MSGEEKFIVDMGKSASEAIEALGRLRDRAKEYRPGPQERHKEIADDYGKVRAVLENVNRLGQEFDGGRWIRLKEKRE